jgi:hypothetical protein
MTSLKQIASLPYTFGVELECLGIHPSVVAYVLGKAGVVAFDTIHGSTGTEAQRNAAARGRYSDAALAQAWTIGQDGSVRGTHPMEIKSPILQGMAGFITLRKVLRVLTSLGVQVNDSTGLHVHVGVKGYSDPKYNFGARAGLEVLRRWVALEREIVKFIPPQRRTNNYCRSPVSRLQHFEQQFQPRLYGPEKPPPGYLTARTDADRQRYLDHWTAFGHGPHIWNSDGRAHQWPERPLNLDTVGFRHLADQTEHYDAVSLASWNKYGTIEFRLHQGSVNPDEVVNWTMFVINHVEQSRKVAADEVTRGRGRPASALFGGLPADVRKHFETQAHKWGSPLTPPPPSQASIRAERLRAQEAARRAAEREVALVTAQVARTNLASVQFAHGQAREAARAATGYDEETIHRATEDGLNWIDARLRADRMNIEAPPAPTASLTIVQRFNSELVAAQARIDAQARRLREQQATIDRLARADRDAAEALTVRFAEIETQAQQTVATAPGVTTNNNEALRLYVREAIERSVREFDRTREEYASFADYDVYNDDGF